MRRVLCTLLALLAVSVTACGGDDSASPPTTKAATTTTTSASTTTAPDRSEARESLVIVPVLATSACPPEIVSTTTLPATTTSTTAATTITNPNGVPMGLTSGRPFARSAPAKEGPYPTADGSLCFTVGDPIGDGNDLTDATLSETEGGQYQVLARVIDDSADQLDQGFDACFTAAPTCPAGADGRGSVAFIWDGTVLYAPSVQVDDLAAGAFSIAGGLTERRARDLLTLINQ